MPAGLWNRSVDIQENPSTVLVEIPNPPEDPLGATQAPAAFSHRPQLRREWSLWSGLRPNPLELLRISNA